MVFPDMFRLLFMISSIIVVDILLVMDSFMFKKKNIYRVPISWPICLACFSTVAYLIFMLFQVNTPNAHRMAVFFDASFFIGTDWLALHMMLFSILYTGLNEKRLKHIMLIGTLWCILDSINLSLNNYYHHMFDLVFSVSPHGLEYWTNDFRWPHYVHLGGDYVMVAATFVNFLIASIKAPSLYKRKYVSILIAYIVVILTNCVCYSLNLPVDFSVILYAVLAGFLCYFSTYSFPQELLNLSLTSVNQNINDGIIYYDISGHCIYHNKASEKIFNKHGKFDLEAVEEYRNNLIFTDEIHVTLNDESFTADGNLYYYQVEFQKEFYEGVEVGACLKLIDRTEESTVYIKKHYEDTHDELTGILNRVGFFEEVDRCIEKNDSSEWLMISSNIKDFKMINDLFGEDVGDKVLLKEANLLKKYGSGDSIFGRISDDKFGLYTRKENFSEEKLMKFISTVQSLAESYLYQMHIFVGIYEPGNMIEPAQVMYDKTLIAINEIYDSYSQSFAYYDSTLMEKLLQEKNMLEEFEKGLENNQIEMVLQPIIDPEQKSFGAEALSRWNHPVRGQLLPADFLNILEKSGYIYSLDEYMWEKAASKIKEWLDAGFKETYISVNVSVKDCYYTDIYKTFTRIVDKYDIPPKCLHIEITEGFLKTDFEKAKNVIAHLQKDGFIVAIDNFGNGYSSLNMLKDFSADILKIDLHLISRAAHDERTRVILKSVISMAKALKLVVVGEGVENQEQYDILRGLGCNVYQGNCLYKPMSIKEYENKFIKFNS